MTIHDRPRADQAAPERLDVCNDIRASGRPPEEKS
jgi:hypothetical protein